MSGSASQYPGSQAYNQTPGVDEFVNRATGSFECSIELIRLAGTLPSSGLHLTLNYASRLTPILGLPVGWSFNLPTMVPGLSLSAGGKSYIVDPNWIDSSGYQSGLRYENNRGISFKQIQPPLALPYASKDYAWLFTDREGGRHYFDAMGKIVCSDDRFGNHILYSYEDDDQWPSATTLSQIVDSFGQTISLTLSEGTLEVSLPDGSTVQLSVAPTGVQTVTDQLGRVTTFTYEELAGEQALIGIAYPTGLTTTVGYATPGIAARLPDGSIRNLPTVQSHLRTDGGGLYEETTYDFGMQTAGATFTGASAGYVYSSSDDGLMAANSSEYTYDVLIRRLDGDGNLLAQSAMFYNGMHLPIEMHVYGVSSGTPTTGSILKTVNTYAVDADDRSATPAYMLPTVVEQFVSAKGDGNYAPRHRTRSTYDGFGKLLESFADRYDPEQNQYVSELQRCLTYATVAWSVGEASEMPASETVTDLVTGDVLQTVHTLTTDQLAIAASAVGFQASGTSEPVPWKTRSFTYDGAGRVVAETNAWTSAAAGQVGPQTTSTSTGYAFDPTSRTLVVETTDALGNTAAATKRTDLPGNPTVRLQRAGGAVYTASFDALGRMTGTVDPRGNAATISYQDDLDGFATVVTNTDPTGYVLAISQDGLGRVVRRADNSVPGGASGGSPTRVLSTRTFDPLGQLASSTDETSLETTYAYDWIGRIAQRSDPDGNVVGVAYDDDAVSKTISMNGTPSATELLDGFGRTVLKARLTAGDDTLAPLGKFSVYSGRGYETSRTLAVLDPSDLSSATKLYVVASSYDAEGELATLSFAGGAEGQVVRRTTYSRDLFGHLCGLSSSTGTVGGTDLESASVQLQTDAAGNVVVSIDGTKAKRTMAYDQDNRLKTIVDTDGVTTTSFTYDPAGNLASMSCGSLNSTRTYDARDRIATISDGARTQKVARNLDGTVCEVDWGDGCSQTWKRDAFGRIVGSVDATGSSTSISYSDLSLVSGLAIGPDSFAMQRGTSFDLRNVLTGVEVTGGGAWKQAIAYDGFGRVVDSTIVDGTDEHGISITYDALDRCVAETLILAGASTAASYSYEPIGRIKSAAISGAGIASATGFQLSLGYDGGANVTTRTEGGTAENYSYDAANRLTSGAAVYDALGRMTADGLGQTFSYDDFGRLAGATTSTGSAVAYTYHPNGLLAARVEGGTTMRFYYDGGQVNAVVVESADGTLSTSFLIHAGDRLAAYPRVGDPSYYVVGRGSALAMFGGTRTSLVSEPYGRVLAGPSTDPAAAFAWKQVFTDPATGLVYLRSRHYSPATMRFLTPDLVPTPNSYAFGLGDPMNRFDPTGHISAVGVATGVLSAIIGIIGIVAAVPTGGASLAASIAEMTTAQAVGAVAGIVGGLAGTASAATGIASMAHPENADLEEATLALTALAVVADAVNAGSLLYASRAAGAAKEVAAAELAQVKNDKVALTTENTSLKIERTTLRQEKADAEDKVSSLESENADQASMLNRRAKRIQDLKAEAQAQTGTISTLERRLASATGAARANQDRVDFLEEGLHQMWDILNPTRENFREIENMPVGNPLGQ